MTLSRKNKTILIDQEAVSALKLVKDGLLYPVTSLMNSKESKEVLENGSINGKTFPFPFILAPSGKKNKKILESLNKDEEVTLIFENKPFAVITVDEVFSIDPKKRIKDVYGTDDLNHPGIKQNLKRIGSLAISGQYELINKKPNLNKQKILDAKKTVNAKHTTALVMAANPLHRAHEKLIRQTLETTDLLIIFLLKPYNEKNLNYKIRKESLEYFIKNFLVTNCAIVVPLENNYIFAGYNEIIIDAIVTKNYGCDRLTVGKNHAGLGIFYDSNLNKSIIDKAIGIDIEIKISNEYVYCNRCATLVSKDSCPHGKHHHISYRSDSILKLLELGIVPPAVLTRKEISAFLLSRLLKNRFSNLEKLYSDLLPVEGLLKEHTEEDFYLELIKLYQTTSLT
jgi:sulfate adenylyltransferase